MKLPFQRWLTRGMGYGLLVTAAAGAPPAMLPGVQQDGSVLLPNQWSLRPAGQQVPVGDFPVNVAVHPGGGYAAVLHSGYGQHEVRIVDLQAGGTVSSVPLAESFYGLAWSPDGKRLFASGGGTEVVFVFDFDAGRLTGGRELHLHDARVEGVPAGMVPSSDGQALYVAECWGQRVEKISTRDGPGALWTRHLGVVAAGRAGAGPDSVRRKPDNDPDAPFPYACLLDEKHGRLLVSLWAKAAILVLDEKTGTEVARWPVGEHPNEMALSPDGRLFVAEANRNSVSVLDAASGRVMETLNTAMTPDAPPGSMPNSLALTPDGTLLFVANATNNNLALFDVATPGHARACGFVPVGWFPTSVRVTPDGRLLVVANGKGVVPRANPGGPFPGDKRPGKLAEYIGGLLKGTVTLIPLPAAADRPAQFGAWTKAAYACGPPGHVPPAAPPAGHPIPLRVGDPSPIRHVLYVIRENRTYDQVFGDVPAGNGDARLCLFPENVTPNAHALAREFVLLDNFYADGEVSADGHEWTMAAYATDFVEKVWPLNYGHNAAKKYDYPSEGHYLVAYPANGYLWNRAAEAGISFRSYGEFTDDGGGTPSSPARASIPVLRGHIDELYPSWDIEIPDTMRAERFAAVLAAYERAGDMPRLQVVQLPGDHTSGARAGERTPTAMVADNDLALGRLVEAVSHSKFWADTVIFVLEDDAQNGPDHVDAHRMPALVISPWTRRGAVDSTLYSTTSMLRTIELILGLQPMSQYDAAATAMWASFAAHPDPTPYVALPARVDLHAKNPPKGWAARASRHMDFSQPDLVDDILLNEVVWRSVRGEDQPMPAPRRAAFFRAHPKPDADRDDD